jgi:hypothetical protein
VIHIALLRWAEEDGSSDLRGLVEEAFAATFGQSL